MNFTELAGAAGLLLMAVLRRSLAGDTFAVGHFWLGGYQANLEFRLGAVDNHVDVLVAHALQDGLPGRLFVVPGECHIFFAQAGQGGRNLGGVGLGLGLDGNPIERAWVIGDGNCDRVILVAQCISGDGQAQLGHTDYIPGVRHFDGQGFFAALDMQAGHALIGAFGLVPHVNIIGNAARKNFEVSHLAHEWVGGGFPDVQSRWPGIAGG